MCRKESKNRRTQIQEVTFRECIKIDNRGNAILKNGVQNERNGGAILKNSVNKNRRNEGNLVLSISDATNRNIKRRATKAILCLSLSALLITSGQVVHANPIQAPQNTAEKATYGNSDARYLLDEGHTGLEISREIIGGRLKAPVESTEPNYANDEAKIKDFGSERYRSTQMQQGNGPTYGYDKPGHDDFIDGFRTLNSEPSATSPDKKVWGIEIEIDKEKGQRTFTNITFSNSGRFKGALDSGIVNAGNVGSKIIGGSKDTNYKANATIKIKSARQSQLALELTEEDLKHINSINNSNTTMTWQGTYNKDNVLKPFATEGGSSIYSFAVNPWPNENDMLSLIKLNGTHKDIEFVQGQTITTDVTVENLDDNARERLVGQVYHPVTGEVVPGAKAYINAEDKVVIALPEGAIGEDGKINQNSIFYKDPNYKGLQNLEVKFFARPRTADEFKAIADKKDEFDNLVGTYVKTGAGTADINHKGKNVTIDKQGIDRYDHYNLIGSFKLNLDDTRYYDQGFIDENKDDTSEHISSKVKPGVPLEVKLYVPKDKEDKTAFPNQKTPDEMNAAKKAKQAVGTIDRSYIDQANKGKAPEDQWKIEYDDKTLPTTFKVTPPASAKAGDFVAVPLTYTYTNGSTDTHWFHFVVQDTANNRPEYPVQVALPSEEQKSTPEVPKDDKKLSPVSYSIPDGTAFKDDKGNEWTVSIDEKTGVVTAKPTDPSKFNGGEKLQVPVIAHYKDPTEPEKDITEKTKAEFVIKERANMTARYNAKAGKVGDTVSSEVILNEEDTFNRRPSKYSLASKTFVDDKGNTWNVSIDENTGKVTATVPNAEADKTIDGALLNVPVTAHYYEGDKEVGTRQTEVQFIASGTKGTYEYTNKIPYGVEIRVNPNLKKGERNVIQKGEAGEEKYTITIENSGVTKKSDPEVTKEAKPEIIEVGTEDYTGEFQYVDKEVIPYDTKVTINPALAPNEIKEITAGESGSKERTVTQKYTNGEKGELIVGEYKTIKQPVTRVIEVGSKTTGQYKETETIPFEIEVKKDPSIPKGEWKYAEVDGVQQKGVNGLKERTITIVNSTVTEKSEFQTTKEPEKAVILVGDDSTTGEVKHEEKLPFGYKVEEVDTLKKGEYKIVKPGKVGTKTTIWKIKDSQVDGKPTEEIVPAEDALIQVGKGTNEGTHDVVEKKELPYKTRIEYDPNLEAGQRKETGGEPGEQQRTNTLVIKDGKVVEIKEGEFKTTKEPIEKVIRIGTKPLVKEVDKPFETEYIYDENVEMGKEEEVTPGENGKVTITTSYDKEQNKLVTKEETKDPVNRVVKVGIKPVVKEEEIPAGKTYKHNPDLKAGEIKKIKDGIPGKVIITTTFNKETGKNETKIERIEPTDAVYEYGSKTEGKVTVESDIPFEVEFVPDDTMAAGETKVTQEGELGKKEITITIENSKEVGKRTEKVIKVPVKKIVKYGTLCKVPAPKPNEPGTPGGNPNKPGTPGGNSHKPGTPGGNPNEPGTPGSNSNEPGTPGSNSNEPGTPGGNSNEPGTPGEKPDKTGTQGENPDKPGTLGTKTPGTPGTEKPSKENEMANSKATKNPKTGDATNISFYAYVMGVVGSALLALGVKKKNNQ